MNKHDLVVEFNQEFGDTAVIREVINGRFYLVSEVDVELAKRDGISEADFAENKVLSARLDRVVKFLREILNYDLRGSSDDFAYEIAITMRLLAENALADIERTTT